MFKPSTLRKCFFSLMTMAIALLVPLSAAYAVETFSINPSVKQATVGTTVEFVINCNTPQMQPPTVYVNMHPVTFITGYSNVFKYKYVVQPDDPIGPVCMVVLGNRGSFHYYNGVFTIF